MINRKAFFDAVRDPLFGGTLQQHQVEGLTRYLDAFEGQYAGKLDKDEQAYTLATVYHETGVVKRDEKGKKYLDRTMSPVEEVGKGRGRSYGLRDRITGLVYYGRGDVQITWKANYERVGKLLGIDLVNRPELALDPAIALRIAVEGMIGGWFTGRKFEHYFGGNKCDFVNARRMINGTDKMHDIAGYARVFRAALG